MENLSIKQIKQITSYEKEKVYGLDVGTKHNNNYASCYAIPISTPRNTFGKSIAKEDSNKGHNGPHQSHFK